MKKVCCLLLTLVLILGMTGAYAEDAAMVQINEENIQYALFVTVPDNAVVTETMENDYYIKTHFEFSDIPELNIDLVTAPSELFDDLNLSDLDDTDKQILVDSLAGEYDDPVVETFTTAGGYEYMVINQNIDFDTNSSSDAMLLVHGYFIQVAVYMDDFSALGDNWMVGRDILDSLVAEAAAE